MASKWRILALHFATWRPSQVLQLRILMHCNGYRSLVFLIVCSKYLSICAKLFQFPSSLARGEIDETLISSTQRKATPPRGRHHIFHFVSPLAPFGLERPILTQQFCWRGRWHPQSHNSKNGSQPQSVKIFFPLILDHIVFYDGFWWDRKSSILNYCDHYQVAVV